VGDYSVDDWRRHRWGYYRLVELVDREIGRVLAAVRAARLLENTLVIFTSDHGECAGAHGWNQKSVPFDESTRVPFIVSWKDKTPSATSDRLVNTGIDIVPTVLAAAGATGRAEELPGLNLLPLALGDTPADCRDAVVSQMSMSQAGEIGGFTPTMKWWMVRTNRYKYCLFSRGQQRESLVDMEADPGEMRNLAADPAYRLALLEHRERLDRYAREHDDRRVAPLLADDVSPIPFQIHEAADGSPFLTAHCVRCHSGDTQEGGVRLDDLPNEIATVETAERWQRVLNVLNAGEMPPAEEPRPAAAAKTEFLAELSQSLADARRTIGDQGRTVTLRRLNRREYVNTLQALLDIEIDSANLPDDQAAGSFDTIGSSLFMSSDQFEQYLALGRQAAAAAIDAWRRSAEPQAPPRTVRTEVETAARRQMAGLLNGYFLGGYRKAKEWQAAGADPAKARDYGFPDEHEAVFRIRAYEQHGPYLGQYLALPRSDEGAWLAYRTANHHSSETIAIPADAPTGRYVLRVRGGVAAHAPAARRFLEMGIEDGDDFRTLDVFQVTASPERPQVIEIPVTIHPHGQRAFTFREKRHADPAAAHFQSSLARATNGVGPDCVTWIDWVEWQGPMPEASPASRPLAAFGTAFPHDGDATTTRAIIDHFATKAFRGVKPQSDYLDRLVAVYEGQRAAGKAFADALIEPLAVVLASPAFLYLNEPRAVAPAAAQGSDIDRSLSDLELASRLSYFLWAAPPDDDLLAAAASGGLRDPERLAAQALRLIADPRSFELAKGFTHQWLDVDRLDFFRFDYQLYPDFDESTREAAKGEIYHTFHTLLEENLDARNLLASDFVVINGLLAAHYGVDGSGDPIQGMHYRRVSLPPGSPRGGLLGMAAVLAMGSNGEHTSPVERGAWVLRKLLNDPPPPAPPNVPQLSRLDGRKISSRERVRMHQEAPQCAQCHRVIDPIGFGLENFDAAGRWRTEDHVYKRGQVIKGGPIGKVVDASFAVDPAGAFHDGPAFRDFFELRSLIAARGDDFLHGLIENLHAYALGRPVSFADAETIDGVVAKAKADGGGLASIIQAIVTGPEFRTK